MCLGKPAAERSPIGATTQERCRLTLVTATSSHPAHRALHRTVANAIQGVLARVSQITRTAHSRTAAYLRGRSPLSFAMRN